MTRLSLLLLLLSGGCGRYDAAPPRLILGTTHTVEESGLLDSLVSAFRSEQPGQDLQVVVAGSGEVLQLAVRGDADVLLTHSPAAELELVRAGSLLDRRLVMHNRFVLLGPPEDPQRIRGAAHAGAAFARMRDTRAPFVSRGDDSGTHRKELALWQALGLERPDWPAYIEAASGMADALRVASERGAYILSERATWLNLSSQLRLDLVFDGDTALHNQYAVTRSARAANDEGARTFVGWITAATAQALIGRYGAQRFGRSLFTPDAL